jgi:hypothetical protein
VGSSGGIAGSAVSLSGMEFPYSTILWKTVKKWCTVPVCWLTKCHNGSCNISSIKEFTSSICPFHMSPFHRSIFLRAKNTSSFTLADTL